MFKAKFSRRLLTEVKWSEMKVTQSYQTLCDSVGYTVHGILQARILEWVAFPFSRGSSQLRDHIQVSRIAGGFFASWATREAQGKLRQTLFKRFLLCVRITAMGERSTLNIPGQVGVYSQGAESGLVDGKYYEETLRITVCSGYTNLMRRC